MRGFTPKCLLGCAAGMLESGLYTGYIGFNRVKWRLYRGYIRIKETKMERCDGASEAVMGLYQDLVGLCTCRTSCKPEVPTYGLFQLYLVRGPSFG